MKEEKKQVKLEHLKKAQVFRVPEGYFEELPTRIIQGIAAEKREPVSVYGLKPRVIYYAAACLAVLLVAWFSLKTPQKTENPESLLSAASTTEMIDYLETNDATSLESILTEEDQQEILDEQLNNFEP